MHHRIQAVYHQAGFSRSACAWLAIDEVPLEQWLAAHLNDPQVASLGLSLIWLLEQEQWTLAKRRFTPAEDGTSTLVPLLVCSDDMDFDCTVLMAEQVIEGETLHWRRFGWSCSGGLEVGVTTRWLNERRPVSFALDEFHEALQGYEALLESHAEQ